MAILETKKSFRYVVVFLVIAVLLLCNPLYARRSKSNRNRTQRRSPSAKKVHKNTSTSKARATKSRTKAPSRTHRNTRTPTQRNISKPSRPSTTRQRSIVRNKPSTRSRVHRNVIKRNHNLFSGSSRTKVQNNRRSAPSRSTRSSPSVKININRFGRPSSNSSNLKSSNRTHRFGTIRKIFKSNSRLDAGKSTRNKSTEHSRIARKLSKPPTIDSHREQSKSQRSSPDISRFKSSAHLRVRSNVDHPVIVAGKDKKTTLTPKSSAKRRTDIVRKIDLKQRSRNLNKKQRGNRPTLQKSKRKVRTTKDLRKRFKPILRREQKRETIVKKDRSKDRHPKVKKVSPRKKSRDIKRDEKGIRIKKNTGRKTVLKKKSRISTSAKHPRHLKTKHHSPAARKRKIIKTSKGVGYEESDNVVKHFHKHKHIHIYRDRHHRICHRIVWPRYHYPVYYRCGPYFRFRYVYPYYHRKYVFVSLGGYWPVEYRYVRYYWYGWHPYHWYGYDPVPQQVERNTYNYYTYNYYSTGDQATTAGTTAGGITPVDENTFADVREKLARQKVEAPEPETLADTYFEDAVELFEKADYKSAADLFAKALEVSPDDIILPFALVQSLFAAGEYQDAVDVLRLALTSNEAKEQGVFYPRGLYPDEDTLTSQIDLLIETAQLQPENTHLQLLLGYQLLGTDQLDSASEALTKAAEDENNTAAVQVLLDLLEKIKAEDSDTQEGGVQR